MDFMRIFAYLASVFHVCIIFNWVMISLKQKYKQNVHFQVLNQNRFIHNILWINHLLFIYSFPANCSIDIVKTENNNIKRYSVKKISQRWKVFLRIWTYYLFWALYFFSNRLSGICPSDYVITWSSQSFVANVTLLSPIFCHFYPILDETLEKLR